MQGGKRIKAIISFAIILIAGLLMLSTYLVVTVNQKKKELAKQKTEISKLENIIEGFTNQDKDNKNNDYEIVVQGEE